MISRSPPPALPLAGDARVCFRRVPGAGGKVLVTSGSGRFILLPEADFEALARGAADPENTQREKLAGLGFVQPLTPPARDVDRDPGGESPRIGCVDGDGALDDACDRLIDAGAIITVRFDGPPYTAAARTVREIHARYAARGIDPSLAYVNAVVTVTRATIDAGPAALVAACAEAGLVYVELSPLSSSCAPAEAYEALACTPDAYLRFQREATRRILDVNLGGTLLVEKRLALHLEALVGGGTLPPGPTGDGCVACVYDPYCGSPLLRRYLTGEHDETKAWGTPHCERSMGTFDGIFALLASPDGAGLRRVFGRWMAARDRVARRHGPR